ncbi:MAG: hypothetical protein IJN93_07780 [Clostridia bacterium]|nr:hypothetical protein [Clostridia bacterium]
MKRIWLICALVMVLVLPLSGCGCDHEWLAATCSASKTCQLCGKTEGKPLSHTFQDATCTTPKTCTICNATEGNALGHTWKNATCSAPKTCTVCKITEGKPTEHMWQEATTEAPKTCSVCNKTEGSKLKTDSRFTTKSTKNLQGKWISDVKISDEMMGIDNFGSVNCRVTIEFGNTGNLSVNLALKDKADFLKKLKTYTIDQTYASFKQEGLTKEQADQAMIDTYGLNVNDYVEASLKDYDPDEIFNAFNQQQVYYVDGNTVYSALNWNAKFDGSEFKINNGQLVINELTLEEGGSPLVFKRP